MVRRKVAQKNPLNNGDQLMSVKPLVFLSLVCSLLTGCASQNGLFSDSSDTSSLRQQYPNTIAYCQKWAAVRNQFIEGTKLLRINDNRADNLQNSEWNDWLAKQTLIIPQLHVDPRLVSLSNEFVGLYRERAKLGRDLEELTQMKLIHKERSEFWLAKLRARIKVFGESNELAKAEQKINEKQVEYNKNKGAWDIKFNDLIIRRNHLRDQLTHDYGEFAQL